MDGTYFKITTGINILTAGRFQQEDFVPPHLLMS